MIKKFYNLIAGEPQLPTPTHKWYSQMLPFLDDYLHAKNLRYWLYLPRILIIEEYCNLISWDRFRPHLVVMIIDFVNFWLFTTHLKFKKNPTTRFREKVLTDILTRWPTDNCSFTRPFSPKRGKKNYIYKIKNGYLVFDHRPNFEPGPFPTSNYTSTVNNQKSRWIYGTSTKFTRKALFRKYFEWYSRTYILLTKHSFHSRQIIPFYTPWRHQKTIGFRKFSGDEEREHWTEMG